MQPAHSHCQFHIKWLLFLAIFLSCKFLVIYSSQAIQPLIHGLIHPGPSFTLFKSNLSHFHVYVVGTCGHSGTFSSDYEDLDKWLNNGTDVLISYCSGPVADDENTEVLQKVGSTQAKHRCL